MHPAVAAHEEPITSAVTFTQGYALTPGQAAVLRACRELTQGDRRPYVTVDRLAAMTGRPRSSVHHALTRLRSLDLVGAAATIGRRGGFRLWRLGPVRSAPDRRRHRQAVARIIGLVRSWLSLAHNRSAPPDPAPVPSPGRPAIPPPPARPGLEPGDQRAWWDDRPESTLDKLRRAGLSDELYDAWRTKIARRASP